MALQGQSQFHACDGMTGYISTSIPARTSAHPNPRDYCNVSDQEIVSHSIFNPPDLLIDMKLQKSKGVGRCT